MSQYQREKKSTVEKLERVHDACKVLSIEMGEFGREDIERKTGLTRSTSARYLQRLTHQGFICYNTDERTYQIK